jgi:hypothetical protein
MFMLFVSPFLCTSSNTYRLRARILLVAVTPDIRFPDWKKKGEPHVAYAASIPVGRESADVS